MTKALDATAGIRLKLHDLTVGQRFSFSDKHRGKVFEIIAKKPKAVIFIDTATEEVRVTFSNRKTFRMEVELVTENRVVEFAQHEVDTLNEVLHSYYLHEIDDDMKSKVNKLYLKINGLPDRRPEGE